MNSNKKLNEQGYTFFVGLFVVALVLGVFIAWGIVANMNKESKVKVETVPETFGEKVNLEE